MQKEISIPAFVEVEPDTFRSIYQCSPEELHTAFQNEKDVDRRRELRLALKALHDVEIHYDILR